MLRSILPEETTENSVITRQTDVQLIRKAISNTATAVYEELKTYKKLLLSIKTFLFFRAGAMNYI